MFLKIFLKIEAGHVLNMFLNFGQIWASRSYKKKRVWQVSSPEPCFDLNVRCLSKTLTYVTGGEWSRVRCDLWCCRCLHVTPSVPGVVTWWGSCKRSSLGRCGSGANWTSASQRLRMRARTMSNFSPRSKSSLVLWARRLPMVRRHGTCLSLILLSPTIRLNKKATLLFHF